MKISKRLRKRFLAVLLVVAIVVPLVINNGGFNTSAASATATVNASSLNVRSGPGTNYGVMASVTKGTTVTILNVGSNGWNQIQLPNGKTGYVSATYLTASSASTAAPIDGAAASIGTVINATLLNVRSGPGTSYSVKTGISGGTQVTVISTSNGWSRIILPNGTEGYVSSTYLSIKTSGSTTTAKTVPAVPTGVTASASTTGATIKWSAVSDATEYQVSVIGDWRTTTNTSYTYSGLKTNTTYEYCVRSKNAVGYSAWGAYSTFKTTSTSTATTAPAATLPPANSKPTTVPAVPTGLAISNITTTGATFKWNAVSGATEYQVNVSGGWVTVTGANTTTHNRTGLKANTSYDYCIRAKNAVGYSAWSSYGYFKTTSTSTSTPAATPAPAATLPPANSKPTTVPAVPTGLAISNITTTGATFKWNAVSGATEYQVNVSGGWVTVTGANTTTHNRTGLKANTSYDYCVRSKNAAGYSAWSSYGYFKTTSTTTVSTPAPTPTPVKAATTKPSVPTNVKATVSGSTVTITWTAVSGATSYKVNLIGDHRTTSSTSYTYTNLKSGTKYDYCVKAINSLGESNWSASGVFTAGSGTTTTTPTPSTPAPITASWTPTPVSYTRTAISGTDPKHFKFPGRSVDVGVWKSSADYNAHIANYVEPEAGGHYYLQSPYTNNYDKATMVVDMSTVQLDRKGKRNAFISFNVSGASGCIDIGLAHDGDGWESYYYVTKEKVVSQDRFKMGNESQNNKKWTDAQLKKVSMTLNAGTSGGSDKVSVDYIFYGAGDVVLGKSTLSYSRPEKQMFDKQGTSRPYFRLLRFVSLVPIGGLDYTDDGTYLRNVKMSNIQVYNVTSKKYENWGLNSSMIQHGWEVQRKNNIIGFGTSSENVTIDHKYKY